jgi:hypothetical protein
MKHHGASGCLGVATVALALAPLAWAQEPAQEDIPPAAVRLFVSDKLVLNVYSEPSQSGERVGAIETGDAVQELERVEGFVRVRLSNGQDGWVGANYLTPDPPAAVRLRELQREQKTSAGVDKKSADEIARLRKQNAALEGELKTLQTSAAASPAAMAQTPPGQTQSFDELADEPDNAGHPPAEDPSGGAARIIFAAGLAAVVAALAGFAAGYHTLARRLRRKFGGLKIY